ncbi:MAG: PilZ domain-containing protein [Siculibacillus sp.]
MTEVVADRRAKERRRALMSGCVHFADGTSSLDCTVRDMSEGGVRLRFFGPPLLPHDFEFRLVERGVRRRARRVWTSEREIGIAFV